MGLQDHQGQFGFCVHFQLALLHRAGLRHGVVLVEPDRLTRSTGFEARGGASFFDLTFEDSKVP